MLVIEPAPLSQQDHLNCLCISTSRENDPDDLAIEMPWDAENGGITGLYQWCRVVLFWFVQIDQSAVDEVSGRVTASFIANVIQQRNDAIFWRNAKQKKP